MLHAMGGLARTAITWGFGVAEEEISVVHDTHIKEQFLHDGLGRLQDERNLVEFHRKSVRHLVFVRD